jgi:hypothetical protein
MSDVTYFAILQKFNLDEQRHALLDMPQLILTDELILCEPEVGFVVVTIILTLITDS